MHLRKTSPTDRDVTESKKSAIVAVAREQAKVTLAPLSAGVLNLGIGAAVLLASALIAAKRQREWEYPVIWAMNSYANRSAVLDYFVQVLTARDLLQGAAFISLLWYL